MISKSFLFIFSWIFFLLWIFINNLYFDIYFSSLVLLCIVVLFLIYWILKKEYIPILFFWLFCFILWVWLSQININIIKEKQSIIKPFFDNKKHEIILEIIKTEKIDEFNKQYKSKLLQIWDSKINKKIFFSLNVPINYELEKWNIIKIESKLYEYINFEDFWYKNYMLTQNNFFNTYIKQYLLIKAKEVNIIEKNIINFRKFLLNTINQIYPKEEAIFLWWILIWARENLWEELKQDFNNSWLTHIIAVSGFNITILILFLTFILQYFPKYIKTLFISIFIAFFVILVGDTAPVIRAAIMWLIWYYIIVSWRKWNILSIIIFTLIIMTINSPLSLNYDISFHLSFLAVLWIIYTQKYFDKLFYFLPSTFEIKSAFTLTLWALCFSLPIIILNFGKLSILSPLANIGVAWTIPFAMIFGFLSIFVYYVYPIAWIIVWYITWILLKWNITIIHFFGGLEWNIINFDLWIYKYHLELLYFIILIFLLIIFREKNKKEQA